MALLTASPFEVLHLKRVGGKASKFTCLFVQDILQDVFTLKCG